MNNTLFNCSCEEVIDETDIDYIITQTFGWLTGIFALVKVFFLTISLLINKYAKNISVIFVIIGLLGAISAIIFGVRINEISIYIRGTIMLILSIIICVAKIVFDIEYDREHQKKEDNKTDDDPEEQTNIQIELTEFNKVDDKYILDKLTNTNTNTNILKERFKNLYSKDLVNTKEIASDIANTNTELQNKMNNIIKLIKEKEHLSKIIINEWNQIQNII